MSQNALARHSGELQKYHGAHQDPRAITSLLEEASDAFNLVTPATSCAHVPEGFAVQMSAVVVADDETYSPGGGKVALGKTALQRIAAAAGISWDPSRSGRIDDGRDPHYCHYRAVGSYRHFDGTTVVVHGEKVMDLREGSSAIDGVRPGEIKMQRKFILEHAETKARLRAIRSMGIRTAYGKDEIRKPFVVAKLAFTGQTADPELRREFARMSAASALGAGQALYGPSTGAQPAALPAPDPEMGTQPAPPVGAVDDRDDDESPAEPEPFRIPGKKLPGAGQVITEVSDEDLARCHSAIMDALDSGSVPEHQVDAVREVLRRVEEENHRRDAADVGTSDEGGLL